MNQVKQRTCNVTCETCPFLLYLFLTQTLIFSDPKKKKQHLSFPSFFYFVIWPIDPFLFGQSTLLYHFKKLTKNKARCCCILKSISLSFSYWKCQKGYTFLKIKLRRTILKLQVGLEKLLGDFETWMQRRTRKKIADRAFIHQRNKTTSLIC